MALDREHSLLSGGLGTVLPIDLASPGACRGDTHARMDMPASAQTAWWSPRCFQAARARVSLPLLDFSLHKWAYWLAHGRPSGNQNEVCFHRLQLRGWMFSFLYQQLHSCPNPHHKARMFTEPPKEVNSSVFWELYLKLLFFPGLLSNFLLSKGNLSPPISNIFSASCKKKRHYFILD